MSILHPCRVYFAAFCDRHSLKVFDVPLTRIVLMIPTLDRSGAEKQFALLAARLPRDEFDVRAIALTRGGPYAKMLADAGVPLTVIGKRAKFDPFSFWRLRAELKALRSAAQVAATADSPGQ